MNKSNLLPKVLRASAGTGKTFQLSSRYLQLLLEGESPDKILATTFTKKAAGEIRERIFHRLVNAAKSEDAARNLATELNLPNIELKQVRDVLKSIINQQHRLLISTLDSFFSTLARSFTSEIGLPAKWSIKEGSEEEIKEFLSDAVNEICNDFEAVGDLLAIIQKNEGGRAVHRDLIEQISQLINLAYATQKEIWSMHLSENEVDKNTIKDALSAFSQSQVPKTKSGEPNKNYIKAIQKLSSIINDSNKWEEALLNDGGEFFKKLVVGEGDYYKIPIPGNIFQTSKPIVQQVTYRILKKIADKTAALRELVDRVLVFYNQSKDKASVVSFDDVKRLIFEAAIVKDLAELFFRIDTKISHILLDEFQDTSLEEWRLIDPIADEILAHSDGSHSFFCVGDTKQSIYGFRGGVAEIFDNLEARWSHLQIEKMEVSRRSSQTILDYINQVFLALENNPALKALPQASSAWQKRYESHSAINKDLTGYVEFTNVPKSRDKKGSFDSVTLAADKIKELTDQNPSLKIGILLRSKKLMGRCLFELNKRNVVASGEGGSALTDSPIVAVLLSYLLLADHPGDSIAHYHVARSPLAKVLNISIDDNIETIDKHSRDFRDKLLQKGLTQSVKDLSLKVDKFCSDRDRTKLQQLVQAAAEVNNKGFKRLTSFVNHIKELRVPDPEQSSVQVMTIHKSKGLEFDAVFLCDLDYDLVRLNRSAVAIYKDSPLSPPNRIIAAVSEKFRIVHPDLEIPFENAKNSEATNELSVIYVALTRARNGLYLYADLSTKRNTVGKFLAFPNIGEVSGNPENPSYSIAYTAGNSNWAESVAIKSKDKVTLTLIPTEFQFARQETEGPRKLKRLSPSEQSTPFVFPVLTEKAKAARGKGLVLHRLFEDIQWLDSYEDKGIEEKIKLWSINHRIDESVINAGIQKFRQLIAKEPFQSLFAKTTYNDWKVDEVTVTNERHIAVVTPRGLEVGTIDRLVIGKKDNKVVKLEILDYKTDTDPSRHLTLHEEQIGYYKEALSEMYKIPDSDISAKLAYVETEEIRSP